MYPDAVCSGARSICKIELATSGVTMKGKKQNVHQHATAGEGPRCRYALVNVYLLRRV